MMRFGVAVALLLAVAPVAHAEDQASAAYQALLTPLVSGSADVLGSPLAYPAGTPKVTGAIVTLPPGVETGWHRHEVPLFAYIIEGELTVDYGEKGIKVYRAGESVLEAMNWPHNGRNTGTVPVKLVAVYIGGGDKQNTIKVPLP